MAERLLFAEEVADLIGVGPTGVKQLLSNARRDRAAGGTGPGLFPEPADRVKREQPREGRPAVAVWSNRWRPADIAAWVESRPESTRWPAARRQAVADQLREMVA